MQAMLKLSTIAQISLQWFDLHINFYYNYNYAQLDDFIQIC